MSKKFIISGGGTGGHIFPAVAIANEIKKNLPDAEILFVGALGKMEMEKVPDAGYKIIGLPIAGLQRRLTVKNLSFPFKLIKSLYLAKKILKEFQPDIAIGVGGYASGPLLRAANNKGINTLIQEQNSYPGITNKLLSKKVNTICVSYDNMEKWFPKDKIVKTGNPVRSHVVELEGKREKGLEHFNRNSNLKTILIVGGSLGARTINESIEAGLDKFKSENVQLIWQTGKYYYERAKQAAGDFQNVEVREFIREMDLAYASADVIISRAGAMSISELSLVKKPIILVPSPNVSEDHQTKNAMALVNKGAALLIKDSESREKLVNEVIGLINNQEKCSGLVKEISKLGEAKATEKIFSEIKKLIT